LLEGISKVHRWVVFHDFQQARTAGRGGAASSEKQARIRGAPGYRDAGQRSRWKREDDNENIKPYEHQSLWSERPVAGQFLPKVKRLLNREGTSQKESS